MPVSLRTRVGGRMPPTRGTAAGARAVIGIPDPNDPGYMPPMAPRTPGSLDPTLGIGLMGRGVAARRQAEQDQLREALNAPSSVATILPDPQWEGLKQALWEAGVTRLRGGVSAFGSNQLQGEAVPIGGTTLNVTNAPAGITAEGFTRAIEAAVAGSGPALGGGALPETRAEIRRRMTGEHALREALRRQREADAQRTRRGR